MLSDIFTLSFLVSLIASTIRLAIPPWDSFTPSGRACST